MFAIIGTWRMSFPYVCRGRDLLAKGSSASDAVVAAVMGVEDDPTVNSVGCGGLPDATGKITLDSGYMNGDTLRYGGVINVENVKNPILASRLLSSRTRDCLLCGKGAELFARENGLEFADLHTDTEQKMFKEAEASGQVFTADDFNHDTVCVIAVDEGGHMIVGTSTSGLFMKKPGRVGDTPIIGSGFYCDSRYGGAAATGEGEEIMRGCLSYEAVSLMRRGASPEDACREAVEQLQKRRAQLGDDPAKMSLIALAPDGRFGAATTKEVFPFGYGNGDGTRLYKTTIKERMRLTTVEEMMNEP